MAGNKNGDGSFGMPTELKPTRPNPFEIALWVLGAVLVAASVGALIWAVGQQYRNVNGYAWSGQSSPPLDFVLMQSIFPLAPATAGGGIACIALALAVRAIAVTGDRRAMVIGAGSYPEPKAVFMARNRRPRRWPQQVNPPPRPPSTRPSVDSQSAAGGLTTARSCVLPTAKGPTRPPDHGG